MKGGMVGEREETSEGRRKGSRKEKRREREGKNRTIAPGRREGEGWEVMLHSLATVNKITVRYNWSTRPWRLG